LGYVSISYATTNNGMASGSYYGLVTLNISAGTWLLRGQLCLASTVNQTCNALHMNLGTASGTTSNGPGAIFHRTSNQYTTTSALPLIHQVHNVVSLSTPTNYYLNAYIEYNPNGGNVLYSTTLTHIQAVRLG
jgi:hypothetical protein